MCPLLVDCLIDRILYVNNSYGVNIGFKKLSCIMFVSQAEERVPWKLLKSSAHKPIKLLASDKIAWVRTQINIDSEANLRLASQQSTVRGRAVAVSNYFWILRQKML
jgi:hypothetical protein